MAEFEYHNAGNSEAQQKEAFAHLLSSSTTLANTGVLDGLVVVQNTSADGNVLISFGAAIVQSSILTGASLLANDTAKTLNIFTANPMGGLPRNDIVVFDQITASIIALIGTPNASPTDPTVPATSVALARLRHAASATTIPTAKIDSLIVATSLRQPPAAAPNPWVNATFAGAWVNYGGLYTWAQYRDMGDGTVMVRGLVKSGAPGTIFTLPVGLRPPGTEQFICLANAGSGAAAVSVLATGVVQLGAYFAGGDNTAVSLSGIRFGTT